MKNNNDLIASFPRATSVYEHVRTTTTATSASGGSDDAGTETHLETGCKDLDELLGGGICRGEVTEVFGTAGCGKTQLVLSLCRAATRDGGRALLVDTDGSISIGRMGELKLPLDRILIMRAADADRTLALLPALVRHTLSKIDDVRLVAIDSVTAIFHGCSLPRTVRRLQVLVDRLSHLSVVHDMAVVLTNDAARHGGVYMGQSVEDENNEPGESALGASWQGVCPVRLCLRMQGVDRHATVVDHPRVSGGHAQFAISSSGFVEEQEDM